MTRTGGLAITTMGMVAFLAALLALLAWHDGPASARVSPAVAGTTIVVNTASDESITDGDCSLREAIRAANSNAAVDACAAGKARERDAIDFSLGQEATITLKRTLPAITNRSGLTIFGGETAKITVSGDDKVRVLAVASGAKLDLRNLTIASGFANRNNTSGQSGGGVKNNGGTLKVVRSTFASNNAVDIGGGIANLGGGTLTVKNATFSGNRAGTAGGAVLNGGKFRVTYSTFRNNAAEFVGGGIQNANDPGATTSLSNTALAKNTGGNINNVCSNGQCRGKIIDGGYNISDDSSYRFTSQTSRANTVPGLDPNGLQDNGGPTQTIALRRTSAAFNFVPEGTNGCGTSVKIDQRGIKRPQGNKCDAGAFEKAVQR